MTLHSMTSTPKSFAETIDESGVSIHHRDDSTRWIPVAFPTAGNGSATDRRAQLPITVLTADRSPSADNTKSLERRPDAACHLAFTPGNAVGIGSAGRSSTLC